MTVLTSHEVAKKLDLSQRQVTNLLRAGKLHGAQLADGTWTIESAEVRRYSSRKQGAGRAWSASTAWATLFELSGQRQTDRLTASTYARLRRRIREATAAEIATKASTRLTSHRFAADDRQKTADALILTGVSATDALNTALASQTREIEGYLGHGSLKDFVREHLLVADESGDVVIHETAEMLDTRARYAPPAVIAADLARSTRSRERSAGLAALEELRNEWLATHTK